MGPLKCGTFKSSERSLDLRIRLKSKLFISFSFFLSLSPYLSLFPPSLPPPRTPPPHSDRTSFPWHSCLTQNSAYNTVTRRASGWDVHSAPWCASPRSGNACVFVRSPRVRVGARVSVCMCTSACASPNSALSRDETPPSAVSRGPPSASAR